MGQVEDRSKLGFSITALHAPAHEPSGALAAACSDGRLRLLSCLGRVEKVTDAAHDGSVVSVRWNRNGTAIATGGEDGALKTWSSSGMIRATVTQGDKPIYSLAWSPDNTSVKFLSVHILNLASTGHGSLDICDGGCVDQKATCRLHTHVDHTCAWRPQNVPQVSQVSGRHWSQQQPEQEAFFYV
jgi:hypothetical protein